MGRSAVAMCAYLMYKYHWGFEKSYDFVYSKKPDIDINKGVSAARRNCVNC
jgi:protein-tyrosine phosphatase